MEGARDRGGREREHVDRFAILLEPLLLADAEALLLVHHEEPQILEADIPGQEPVGADDDVDRPVAEARDDLALLLRRAEARQRLDVDGETGQTLAEGTEMLVGEDRRGGEDGHLRALLHDLERGADRDLRLPERDIAAHETVHRDGCLEVVSHGFPGAQLVRRLLVQEGGLHLSLPRRLGREGAAGAICRRAYNCRSSTVEASIAATVRFFSCFHFRRPSLWTAGGRAFEPAALHRSMRSSR